MNQIDQTWLENRIRASISDDFYLDREEEKQIKQEGTNRGIGIDDIELILQVELDKLGAVSDRILTNELDHLLHQFTDNDEVLDRKEERDALNKVCSPAHGKKIGLDYKVAEDYVKNFCKVNGVTRDTDSKKWVKPLIIVLSILLLISSVLVFIFITKDPVIERVVETKIERVVETKMIEPNSVILNDNDKIQIDDLLRRTQQYVEKSQFTDPPEKSAKSTLDEIKQIDPSGQYRGDEVKLLLSKIVDHYIELAKKSAAVGDLPKASKWLDRAKLLNTDRESISDEEKTLGLTTINEGN
jgi:hypothetical protein